MSESMQTSGCGLDISSCLATSDKSETCMSNRRLETRSVEVLNSDQCLWRQRIGRCGAYSFCGDDLSGT